MQANFNNVFSFFKIDFFKERKHVIRYFTFMNYKQSLLLKNQRPMQYIINAFRYLRRKEHLNTSYSIHEKNIYKFPFIAPVPKYKKDIGPDTD